MELFLSLLLTSVTRFICLFSIWKKRPRTAEKVGYISGLYVYPVHSMSGICVDEALATRSGLKMVHQILSDRDFIVVKPNGQLITQQDEEKMVLIQPCCHGNVLHLTALGMEKIGVKPRTDAKVVPFRTPYKNWSGFGLDCGDFVANWLGTFLGQPCRLLHVSEPSHCTITGSQFKPEDDVFDPTLLNFLMANQVPTSDLNLDYNLDTKTFLPNIVVDVKKAFEEDKYRTFYIAESTRFRTGQSFHAFHIFGVNLFLDFGDRISVGQPLYGIRKEVAPI